MIRFGIRELRKGVLINFIVVLQTAIILVITCSILSAARSRYTYFAPIRNFISGSGDICYFSVGVPVVKADLQNSLHGEASVHMSYMLYYEGAVQRKYKTLNYIVYDDELLNSYTPDTAEGSWKKESNSPDTVYGVVYEGSGYQINDTIEVPTASGDKVIQICGIMNKDTLVLGFDFQKAMNNDFRMLYVSQEKMFDHHGSDLIFLSASEASKLNYTYAACGTAFIQYRKPITAAEKAENEQILSFYRTGYQIENAKLRKNSLRYIFEQLRTLSPVIIGAFILLLISLICSAAVFANRQRRTYAIYEMLGLTRAKCLRIAVWKSVMLSLCSFILVGGFLFLKPHFSAFNYFMIEWSPLHIIAAIGVLLINLLISLGITAFSVKSTPYANSRNL